MKKNIFCLFFILPILVSCQNRWQTLSYNEVTVQVPFDWGNKNTINHHPEIDITEYQMNCWSKEGSMTLIVQWVDIEIGDELYIEAMIEVQNERFPFFEVFNYSEIVDTDFLNQNAKKCHFSNYLDNDGIKGEYIAFTKNQHSYIVLIFGDEYFYKSEVYNTILNSIEPNFSGNVKQQEENVKVKETNNNFTSYEFEAYSLSVPNTLELRNENSMMSLIKEISKDKLETIKKIDTGDVNFVFQPAGTDNLQNPDRRKKALDLYARVLISYEKATQDKFFSWDDDITYSQDEYNKVNKLFKENLLSSVKQNSQTGIELVSIDDIEIGKNANKFVYFKQQYIRKGLNGDILVIDCYLHNSNEMVNLIISYRISESTLWESDFNKIIDTFSFTTKNNDYE